MSISISRLFKIAFLGLIGLGLVVVMARPNPATSIRKINESLAGREKREEGTPVSIELIIDSGPVIEIRLTNRSDRELTIYPPVWNYSIHFEFFDPAGDAFQPETLIALELPRPTERNLVTIGPQETLICQVPLETIEHYNDIGKAAFVVANYDTSEWVREALGDVYDLRDTFIFSNVGAL